VAEPPTRVVVADDDVLLREGLASLLAGSGFDVVGRCGDTRVGEGGSTLSGGQRQRVSIARALLKDAPVVVLDEATAALDPENDATVGAAVAELGKRSTLLVIAHRLQTVRAADQILVLNDGHASSPPSRPPRCGPCARAPVRAPGRGPAARPRSRRSAPGDR
jgi:ABC-type sugar transport system ATPase subunit